MFNKSYGVLLARADTARAQAALAILTGKVNP